MGALVEKVVWVMGIEGNKPSQAADMQGKNINSSHVCKVR